MTAPTHVEVTISAMVNTSPNYATLAERGDEPDFYDVEARRVETDPDHPDWTGEIDVVDEVENVLSYHNAVEAARQMCIKHGLEPNAWVDEGAV